MSRALTSAAAADGISDFGDYARYVAPLQSVDLAGEDRATFRWNARLHAMGPASFSVARVSHHSSERTRRFCSRAALDHVIVYYRQSGWGEMRTGAGSRTMGKGDIAFMDMSQPMAARGPIDSICVGLPRSLIGPMIGDADALHGLVLSPGTSLGRLAASHLDALASEIGSMDPEEAGIVADATAGLLAACANASLAASDEVRVRARPALLLTIRHHIEQRIADRTLGAETIARHFALSRSTLFRLFHPFGGIEVYIRRRRLARAYQTLARSGRSDDYIYQVAEAFGFSCASVFSRAFRTEFGHTPKDIAADGAAPQVTDPGARCSSDLSRCLMDMVFRAP